MSQIQTGSLWKNSEDEILKAAVMKYGLNNWSRVASLLVMKSAKQCKSRWYEWLDPRVKKADWTREEEERLLHLARLFPCQWRTIAPLVGRTAHQCLEHYELLLDRATGEGLSFERDPRKPRPGEIDPHPETRPSKPDSIDLDDHEIDMLSEARARLANTNGRKAKRKARERHLEEARRVAMLQKRRELKASGMLSHASIMRYRKKKYKGNDYLNEIPFEELPEEGVFERDKDKKKEKKKVTFSELEESKKSFKQSEIIRKDKKYLSERKNDSKDFQFEEPLKIFKKKRLNLPTPHLTLEDVKAISSMQFEVYGDDDSSFLKFGGGSYASSEIESNIAPLDYNGSTILEKSRNILKTLNQPGPFNPTGMEKYVLESEKSNNFSESAKTNSRFNSLQKKRIISESMSSKTSVSSIIGRHRTLSDRFSLNSGSILSDRDSSFSIDPIGRNARLEMYKIQAKSLLYDLPPATNKTELDVKALRRRHKLKYGNVERNLEIGFSGNSLLPYKSKDQERVNTSENHCFFETKVVRQKLPRPYVLRENTFSKMEEEEENENEADLYHKQASDLIRKELKYLFIRDMRNHPQKIPEYVLETYGSEIYNSFQIEFENEIHCHNGHYCSKLDQMLTFEEISRAEELISNEIHNIKSERALVDRDINLYEMLSNYMYDPKYIYVPFKKEYMLRSELSEEEFNFSLGCFVDDLKVVNEDLSQQNKQLSQDLEDTLQTVISDTLKCQSDIQDLFIAIAGLKTEIELQDKIKEIEEKEVFAIRLENATKQYEFEKDLNRTLQKYFYQRHIM